jgi:hypothetical protein
MNLPSRPWSGPPHRRHTISLASHTHPLYLREGKMRRQRMYHTDRIRIGSVAAMLSNILAVHQTQAQNAPRASWMFPTASAFNRFALAPKEVLGHFGHAEGKNIGKNKDGEISAA